MSKRLRVATIVGTRPEIIRLSRVMPLLDEFCDHSIIHTGQNYDYELNEVFFEDLQIRQPDVYLNASAETGIETVGKVIVESARVLKDLKPDAVLVLGDTNSAMAVVSAKRLKVPIFHMEAGNRCFDMRVPEEINRRIVDHVADINLPYSQIAREYLLAEGIDPRTVIVTGSPMNEVLAYYAKKIASSDAIRRLDLERNRYFVVSAHREENVDSDRNYRRLMELVNWVADDYGLPVVFSVHPRTRKRIAATGGKFHGDVRQMKPFSFTDYVSLQKNAKVVLSDSGTITEESSILGFAAVNLREAHERPEGMEEGAVMMTGMNIDRVQQAIEILTSQGSKADSTMRVVHDYTPTNVSQKIVRLIHSYVDFVNRETWKNN